MSWNNVQHHRRGRGRGRGSSSRRWERSSSNSTWVRPGSHQPTAPASPKQPGAHTWVRPGSAPVSPQKQQGPLLKGGPRQHKTWKRETVTKHQVDITTSKKTVQAQENSLEKKEPAPVVPAFQKRGPNKLVLGHAKNPVDGVKKPPTAAPSTTSTEPDTLSQKAIVRSGGTASRATLVENLGNSMLYIAKMKKRGRNQLVLASTPGQVNAAGKNTTVASEYNNPKTKPPQTDKEVEKTTVGTIKPVGANMKKRGGRNLVFDHAKNPIDGVKKPPTAAPSTTSTETDPFAQKAIVKSGDTASRATLVENSGDSMSIAKMKKHGRNQLVLASTTVQVNAAGKNTTVASEYNIPKAKLPQTDKDVEKTPVGTIKPVGAHMKKRGRNQLVLEKKEEEEATAAKDDAKPFAVPGPNTEHQLSKERPKEASSERDIGSLAMMKAKEMVNLVVADMEKRGRHKLVLQHPEKQSLDSQSVERSAAKRGIQGERKRRKKSSPGASVKRVKLNVEEVLKIAETCEPEQVPHSEGDNELTQQKRLTEFAYRETSKKAAARGRKRPHHGWIRGAATTGPTTSSPTRRNMGLVRVVPDVSKTRVCPTFARGVACENEKCTMRHDVPQEAATPICSFFQRNGQCLKRDSCPFRHVKINFRTTVCPSFSLLGFCEDRECRMKHVRQHTSNSIKRSDSANGKT